MKKIGLVLAGVLVASAGLAAGEGLYAEQGGSADGVKIRRWRDTTNGVVCYVVIRGEYNPEGAAGISCVRTSQ